MISWFTHTYCARAPCCRFQSYLQSVNHIPGIHDNGRPVTFDFNSILPPGGYVSLRPVHHPRKSLSERHPKRGWTARAHQARDGVSLPNFLPFPRIVGGPVRGICEFDTLFSIFSCFWYPKRDTCVTRRVVKIYPFYAFLFTRMMYRLQWDISPRDIAPTCTWNVRHFSLHQFLFHFVYIHMYAYMYSTFIF